MRQYKNISFHGSEILVYHENYFFANRCGVINGSGFIECPFYECIFRDGKYTFWRVKNNVATRENKNLERHRCLLLEQKYGTMTANELWAKCPGEEVIIDDAGN